MDSVREEEKLEARKILKNRAENPGAKAMSEKLSEIYKVALKRVMKKQCDKSTAEAGLSN